MKRRGKELCVINHRKLSNNPLANYSDEYLLQCMIKQFKSFTLRPLPNVLVIKSDELFQPAIHEKLKQFLHKSVLNEFPIKFVPPKTDINEISAADAALFEKYKKDIDHINNWQPPLNQNNISLSIINKCHLFFLRPYSSH
jgi:hypothetical protein